MRSLNVLLVRILLIISLAFILQACASPRMAEEFEQGKMSFAAGDFKQAFHELLPVAVSEVSPQAQYAVGYMYYNGYGVSADTESGIFWMSKAAQKGYVPAQNALRMIQEDNLQAARSQRQDATKGEIVRKVNPHNDDLRAFPTSQNKELEFVPDETLPIKLNQPSPIKTASKIKSIQKDEVLQSLASSQPVNPAVSQASSPHPAKTNYTLQLFGSYDLSNVKELQEKLASKKLTRSWRTEREGKKWFVLTYGEFKTVADARSALEKLPDGLRDMEPWVRPVEQLKTVV